MQAGKLKHRITIQHDAPSGTVNDYNEPVIATVLFAKRWAEVLPLNGSEAFFAQQVTPKTTHTVRMRFLDGVTAKMQVLHRGRTFNILSVLNTEERDYETILSCVEVGP
jgi:SPP1 family predicted phage head-tail adaptor